MCQQSLAGSISKAFYRTTAEQGEAAQLCVFILGMQYLYLHVLRVCLGMGVPYTYSSVRNCAGCEELRTDVVLVFDSFTLILANQTQSISLQMLTGPIDQHGQMSARLLVVLMGKSPFCSPS